jgi:hypothetical protein
MSGRVFWTVVGALSLINFGTDLVIAGTEHLSGWELMVMTGSWLVIGGLSMLVWLITSQVRNGNGKH